MSSLIEDLLDPSNLPEGTRSVSLVQTHISMVFVADKYVYKIKKPVDFGFLDFRTLEKRAYYCLQEVALNRRLASRTSISMSFPSGLTESGTACAPKQEKSWNMR